jgi:hypothetical protein
VAAKTSNNEPAAPPTVEAALDILLSADDERRYELMDALESSPRTLRLALRDRIIQELNGRFAPASTTLPDTRGWLVTAAAVATPEPDAVLVDLLSSRIDPRNEPSEWVRYWSLAHLCRKYPYDAPRLAERAEKDPAELMRALALAAQAKTRRDLTARLLAMLQNLHSSHRVWAALRALQVAPIAEAVGPIVALLARLSEPSAQEPAAQTRESLTYDALLALAAPETLERAAPELESVLGAVRTAEVVLASVRGARRHIQLRLSRILTTMKDRATVIARLREIDTGSAPPVLEAARFLLEQLGVAQGPTLKIAAGADRIDFVYRLVVSHPSQFELLETFDPARIRQLVQTLGSELPPDESKPNALWRSWVEAVHGARLSEES